MSTSRGGPSRAKSRSTGSRCLTSVCLPTTRYCRSRPPSTVTVTRSPTSTPRSGKSAPTPCCLVSTWPATTAAPAGSPGAGPYRYQPTCRTSRGMTMNPRPSTPTGVIVASTPTAAIRSRTGAGAAVEGDGAAGRAVSLGSAPEAVVAVGLAPGAPMLVTATPASGAGRVANHVTGTPTATATHATTTTSQRRTGGPFLKREAGADVVPGPERNPPAPDG